VSREAAGARRPLRLLVYTDNRNPGGADLSLSHLVAALDPQVDVAVLGVSGEIVEWVGRGRPRVETAVVPEPRSDRDWRSLRAHLRAVRSLRPDVVHANLSSPWSCQYAIAAAALTRRRIVAVYQLPVPAVSSRQRFSKGVTSLAVARHVGVGERTSREVEILLGLPLGSVATVHNGVPDIQVDARARPCAGPIVGAVGRLEQQKGFDVLLRALRDVDSATLVVVGDGSERQHLQALARSLGVEGRVHWHGWSEDARSFLRSFDLLVVPSRFEGFPLVVLEAHLAETAVVATDVGSVAEAVLDGETGLLVPPDDAEALTLAIRRLLGDPDLRRRLAVRGRRLVLDRFTAEHMAREFRSLYDEVLP
jgi:glycosyltransferase involved in cell wall biosynthesis